MNEENSFQVKPPSNSPSGRPISLRRNEIIQKDGPEIPYVWTQIQKEQKKIIEAPNERAKEQHKTDLVLKVRAAVDNPKKIEEDDDSEVDDDIIEIKSKIDTLLDEHKHRTQENETNLVELRIVLDNLTSSIDQDSENEQIDESTKYIGQVQEGQNRLQESINYLVKGAAQLFMQKNHVKIEKLRSDINDITFLTSQVDEQIRIKNSLLEEKLDSIAKIDASNAILRRRIEGTKNEIRAIAGQDFENIPELARTYNDTMKKILEEETELTKQLWNLQSQLEKEKKEQVQMGLLYQKVKDHPIRVAQLTEEMEAKISQLRSQLYEKEKQNSLERGQTALQYQTETQRLVMQARKEREEQLFSLKTTQIQNLLQAEKQSRDDKIRLITGANSNLSGNKSFKQKLMQFENESKSLVTDFENSVKQIKQDFQQAERRVKKEQEQQIQELEEKGKQERKGLESEVSMLDAALSAKNEQYQHSQAKLQQLQDQLTQLKEKIARIEVNNQQLENSLYGSTNKTEDLMQMLIENEKRKEEEKRLICRELMESFSSLAYFMVLTGEKEGDWVEEAKICYKEAIDACESSNNMHVPVPFERSRPTLQDVLNSRKSKSKRRKSFS
ncbi:hypothetical protein TVAG_006470 [Trichomonas vaginalis G3]|uniref:Uncharacterized protein n=1 Tax=Trichomonas vaginalis (strain ATCC PRA-98 / G3) TaxID=412133 RepID=A2E754_TRIV3|nr:hypothetical protein TVAGG3_0983100 [Trichomonas vaginalis G3]EAY11572.1 hypothetical protein TVAG_006470 [Trichomonas vaginalis G3]KAI5489462.1 hypothetical protein TVAGG3_0983100 [Trichomonas vaginalis G3]|eukprot:XP_001323795.1 hypothetical protein [Trichomonas vaginalis G3]